MHGLLRFQMRILCFLPEVNYISQIALATRFNTSKVTAQAFHPCSHRSAQTGAMPDLNTWRVAVTQDSTRLSRPTSMAFLKLMHGTVTHESEYPYIRSFTAYMSYSMEFENVRSRPPEISKSGWVARCLEFPDLPNRHIHTSCSAHFPWVT